ncbi:hypothetical protein MJ575_13885 [Klebsiella pneumoniae]|nr:hypothetical protein MJ575_13885 [Klebsiella pneumoniae]
MYAENGRHFQLRRGSRRWAARLASTPLARSAQPVLRHLSEMLNEVLLIATLDGDDILYIAPRLQLADCMTIDTDIGGRLPAWSDLDGPGAADCISRKLQYAGPGDHDPLYLRRWIRCEAARRTETRCISGMPQRSGAGDGAALPRGPAV